MRDLFALCIDFIFPPSEDALLVRALTQDDMTRLFQVQHVGDATALSEYAESGVRALIHEAKFHGNTHAFRLLNVLVRTFLEQHEKQIDAIIPVPLSRGRMRARGFNQVAEILRAQNIEVPVETSVLIRTRDTRPQTELERSERLMNVRDAFGVTHAERIRGKHILLIDDVVTTGATLSAAKAALLRCNPASIICLALAH